MSKLALALALLIAGGIFVANTAVFADDAAAKKCEEEKDAAKKEECMKAAKGG